ncbi:MAG: hypothetical protein HFI60_03545 [Lachnospiraceae bacterium]|jgi:hypothetical protein|nr:hypothetical protein [Lachnospiraceae bacterium]
MFAILAGIVGLIAVGCLIAYAVVVTIKWLRNKISEKLAKRNVKKVAVADLEELINECDNTVSLSALNDLVDNGYTHLTAEVGYGGEVVSESVEVIKDASDSTDQDVKELINRTKQGMIIVEA